LVLVYVGSKIFVQQFIGKIDPAISLTITIAILLGGILLSLWKTRRELLQTKPVAAHGSGHPVSAER
jgi:predicted tellurium resistance membrane protein TerC